MDQQFFQKSRLLHIETRAKGFHMITGDLEQWLREIGAEMGTLTVLMRHTSASLTVQENADPTVREDLTMALDELAPEDRPYQHCNEGADDMPAHIKTMLTDVSLTLPVIEGRLDLGMWQGVYVVEHRAQRHQRSVRLLFQGSGIS
jgi:secondary thiamine-phosphate synthase enzyme